VEILVLDEADRMLDMGFIHDVRKILALLPAARQSLLFSATFSGEIRTLASGMLKDPASIQVTPRNTAPELVSQLVIPVDRERKRELLSHLVRTRRIDQALVFTRTKHGANRLAEQLDKDGIAAAAIHGNKSQPQRVRALNDFKQGRVLVLVATDIAARGIDIDSLPHVVNFELPTVPEDYVHRIGRTGRAGVDGTAISLVCVDEARLLRDIEGLLRHPIDKEVVPGFEPDPRIRPEPIKLRSGMGRPQVQRPQQGFRPPAPRPAPRYEPRAEPVYEERFAPRPVARQDARPAPRHDPRPAPRYDARPEPRHDPRFDQRPAGPRPEHRGEPRPSGRPSVANGSIGNRPPAPAPFRNAARRPRPADWRTGPREGRPAR
jgi:ATP-dependent RNA helicase RhlE